MADPNSTRPPMHSRSKSRTALYERTCPSCGVIAIVDYRLLGKMCMSCTNKARSIHGLAKQSGLDPIYSVFCSMKARCERPSSVSYKYYGARGIKICKEWRENPMLFVEWARLNGWKRGLQIDRKDTDGDYKPDNCRIVTNQENNQNKRNISTTPDQVRRVREMLRKGFGIKETSVAVGVTYSVAAHIKYEPNIWSNV